MQKKKVVVAMSGGVDSSVTAALLLQEGYDVIGLTMRLWTQEREDVSRFRKNCCSVEAIDDARSVCQALGVPYYVLNFEREFKTNVVDHFINSYQQGRTPNPCLACNQFIKFDALLRKARALGADFVATGHYARIEHYSGRYHLLRAVDASKDQSYVLFTLTQEEMKHILMPMGRYTKAETRRIAESFGLPVAFKEESQDICFIPDRNYRRFISERLEFQPGPIIDSSGKVLGTHNGIAFYTVGQRQGLGIAASEPLYVRHIDVRQNSLVLGTKDELLAEGLVASKVNFISGEPPSTPQRVMARIRYRAPEVPALVSSAEEGLRAVFDEPQRAVTPGQAVVFYDGDEVKGGGIIDSALPVGTSAF